MAIIKLRALVAFEDQDGKFKKGEEFLVNDERAQALIATERAERCADQSLTVAAADEAAETHPPKGFGVPKKAPQA